MKVDILGKSLLQSFLCENCQRQSRNCIHWSV